MENDPALLCLSNHPESRLNSQVPQSPTLAPELLLMILNRTVTPDFLLPDSSLSSGLNSPWYQSQKTKLSISTVCKSWHAVGIEFLYENIVFQHLAQLPAFLRTLVTAREKYQHLIKGITVHTLVTPQYGASFTKYLQDILDKCLSLRRFSFLSPCALPSTAALPTLSSNIMHLSFNDITPTALHLLRCTRNSLISLSVTLRAPALKIDGDDESFMLPNLEDLILDFEPFYPHIKDPFIPHADVVPWEPIMDYEIILPLIQMLVLLKAPRLRRFAINSRDCPWEISGFLQQYGHQVRVLFLETSREWPPEDIQPLLDACPILEHLVIQAGTNASITHPTIRWVDLWGFRPELNDPYESITIPDIPERTAAPDSLIKRSFPKLERYRDINVFNSLQRIISLKMTPDLITSEDDSPAFDFPGIQLRCELDEIVMPQSPFNEDSDSEADNNYYVDEASSDEDSDSDSDSEYSDEHSSCSTGLEDWEMEEPVDSSDLIELLRDDDGTWMKRFNTNSPVPFTIPHTS
ncbi:hypothetical protein H0H92_004668 [Tricholoma furcatifolium]|nr:hypothetical protein H0H92_004668 [Tricholoma furcatifolium]